MLGAAYMSAQQQPECDSCENDPSQKFAVFCGGVLGFVVSHAYVLAPIVHKRIQAKNACSAAQKEILATLTKQPKLSMAVTQLMNKIMRISYSKNENGNASRTWGRRKALMTSMLKHVNDLDLTNDKQADSFLTFCSGAPDTAADLSTYVENYQVNTSEAAASFSSRSKL